MDMVCDMLDVVDGGGGGGRPFLLSSNVFDVTTLID